MPRYLSPEWVQAFNAVLADLTLADAITAAGRDSVTASEGTFKVAQVVTDTPAEVSPSGQVRTVLNVEDGHVSLALDPDELETANVTIVLGYADALAMAKGELQPADALAAGRVRVRGELAVLVAGQLVLQAAASAAGPPLGLLSD
jgi:hypothetical protein